MTYQVVGSKEKGFSVAAYDNRDEFLGYLEEEDPSSVGGHDFTYKLKRGLRFATREEAQEWIRGEWRREDAEQEDRP